MVSTNAVKREMVETVAMDLHRGTLGLPVETWALGELEYFEYENTESGNVRMNAAAGHHDDFVMALSLARRSAGMRPSSDKLVETRQRTVPPQWDA